MQNVSIRRWNSTFQKRNIRSYFSFSMGNSFVSYSVQMENSQMFLQQLCISGVSNSPTHSLCLPEQDAPLTEGQVVSHKQYWQDCPFCKVAKDICIAFPLLHTRGDAHIDGQHWDPVQQYQKPTARLGCPNRLGIKANKLDSSLEHLAKAVCQGEIPSKDGLQPGMWGERIKEVHLKLTRIPSPPNSYAVSSGLMRGSNRSFCWRSIRDKKEIFGETQENGAEIKFVRASYSQHKPLLALIAIQSISSIRTNERSVSCTPRQCAVWAGSTSMGLQQVVVPRETSGSWFRTTKPVGFSTEQEREEGKWVISNPGRATKQEFGIYSSHQGLALC